jgi:hypothetical protein
MTKEGKNDKLKKNKRKKRCQDDKNPRFDK